VLLDLGLLLLRDGNQGLVEGVVVLGVLWMDAGEEKKTKAKRNVSGYSVGVTPPALRA